MGRYIYCKVGVHDLIVWKYKLGEQASEMYRISTELGIGEYHRINGLEDILILIRSDLEKLEVQIQAFKSPEIVHENKWFIAMIEAIRDVIVNHPEQDKFIFEGVDY